VTHRRHVNEFLKSGLANSGRAAGSGIVEDSYDDESDPGNVYRQGTPAWIKEREKQEEYPVKTYYVEVTE